MSLDRCCDFASRHSNLEPGVLGNNEKVCFCKKDRTFVTVSGKETGDASAAATTTNQDAALVNEGAGATAATTSTTAAAAGTTTTATDASKAQTQAEGISTSPLLDPEATQIGISNKAHPAALNSIQFLWIFKATNAMV